MKTRVAFAVRCSPKKTLKKLEALTGTGVAYITELSRFLPDWNWNQKANPWKKIEDSDLNQTAEEGYDIAYRTAALQGHHQCYKRQK